MIRAVIECPPAHCAGPDRSAKLWAMLRILPVLLATLAACSGDGPVLPDAGVPDLGQADRALLGEARGERGGDRGTDRGGAGLTCPNVRETVDRADDSELFQARVLYVLSSDGTDEGLDTNNKICNSVRAFTHWLGAQTGGRVLRLDTHAGELDVGFVRLGLSNAELEGSSWAASIDTGYKYVRDRIERELHKAGLLKQNKLYMVYYGGTSIYACGGAAYPPALVGRVAAVYLKGQPQGGYPCESDPWGGSPTIPHYLDYSILHDTLHVLGIVGVAAPHHHSSGHVFDGGAQPNRDLMYQPRPGTNDSPWDTYNPQGLLLDLGGDDYFEHSNAALPDLAKSVFLDPLPAGAVKPPSW